MKSLTDYTSKQDPSKPSLFQVMDTTEEITGYEPGESSYHDAAVSIAEELADNVTERNEDATYDQVFDIEPEAFEMLDRVGGQRGLINKEQMEKLENREIGFKEAYHLEEGANHYDAGCAGLNAAAAAVQYHQNPESGFNIQNEEELRAFAESFSDALERRIGGKHLDKAINGLERGLRSRDIETTAL
jgi:hypothetical protein